jgi:hypothetical protein
MPQRAPHVAPTLVKQVHVEVDPRSEAVVVTLAKSIRAERERGRDVVISRSRDTQEQLRPLAGAQRVGQKLLEPCAGADEVAGAKT